MNSLLYTTQILQERYQLQEQLGKNSGRQTWLATDIQALPPEPVTVKLLAFSPQMQWDEFKLFEREANVLKQLNHPRIPKYRDYFSLDKQAGNGLCWFGLVQDYIPGYSLQELLNQGRRFTEAEVRSLALQVLVILRYLHGLNPPILHRDIKPSNLILGKDKRVYLVDFGAVQDAGAVEGVTFTVVGTSGYTPLEQFWGQAVPASDLYALGATLIHLLTGVSPADLPQRNLRIKFKDKVSINPGFLSWIEALVEPDLNLRLTTTNEAIESLQTGRLIYYPLQTLQPHFRSRIQIQKSPNQLKIKIPINGMYFFKKLSLYLVQVSLTFSLGISLFLLALLLIFLTLILFMLFATITSSSFVLSFLWIIMTSVGITLFGLLFKAGGKEFGRMVGDLLSKQLPAISHYLIEFDRASFVIECQYLNLFSSYKQGCTSDILEAFAFSNSKTLFLRTKMQRYNLGQTSTYAECQWIVQQIQEWLAEG
ncbi:MAG TPA: serine/threonine-protein kinase [Coleofasciculaceae cyanobacterium]